MNLDWSAICSVLLIQRLGWALLHSIWQIALIAMIFALAIRMLGRCSPASRYIAGCIALSMMLCIPLVTFFSLPRIQQFNVRSPASTTRSESDDLNSQRTTTQYDGSLLATTSVSKYKKTRGESQSISSASERSRPAASRASQNPDAWRLESLFPSIVICWFIGAVVMICRPLLGFLAMRRMRTTGVSPVPTFVQSMTQRLKMQMGLRCTIEVVQSTLVSVPSVIGVFYPLILLPASVITSLPPEQLAAVIAHELAHIRRHDFLVNILQTMVETLLFYHPLVWWVSRRVRHERENCCDDAAILASGDRLKYAQALFAVDLIRGGHSQLSMSATGGSIVHRIQRIKGEPYRSGYGLDVCCSVVILALGLILANAVDPIDVEAAPRHTASAAAIEIRAVRTAASSSLSTFEQLTVEFPPENGCPGTRLEITSAGSYCISLTGLPAEGDPQPDEHRRRGVLSSESLATLGARLSPVHSLTNRLEESTESNGRTHSSLRVRLKSGEEHSWKLGLQETECRGSKLIDFLQQMVIDELENMTYIPWEPYSRLRFQEAVATQSPVLLYHVSPKFSLPRRPSVGRLDDTVRLLRKHGIVCLSNAGSLLAGKVNQTDSRKPPKFPDSSFGLSLYLPKTGRTVSISNDRVGALYFALKRTLEDKDASGLIDIGGDDFSIFSPVVPKRIGDLTFSVITEAEWVLPEKKGDTRMLTIHFRMQNANGGELYFPRTGTHFPVLEDSNGNVCRYVGEISSDRPSDRRIRGTGPSTFKYFAFLERDQDRGEVYFCFRDGREKIIRLGPIEQGNYRLKFELQSCPLTDKQRNGSKPANLWSGQGSTWAVPIVVHDWDNVARPRKAKEVIFREANQRTQVGRKQPRDS